MSEPKFTPGPWVATPDPNAFMDDDYCVGVEGSIDSIACCSGRDAHLIAAAPDMYKAMQRLCDRVDAGEVRSVKTYAAFKAILRKARGETDE